MSHLSINFLVCVKFSEASKISYRHSNIVSASDTSADTQKGKITYSARQETVDAE